VTFDQSMQFYHLPIDPNAEPSVFWVSDVDDPFVPFPREGLMVNVKDDRERIDAFLEKLVALYYTEARKNLPI
jgi:hypothetical protein